MEGARGELSGKVEKRMRLPSAETRITIGGIGAMRKRRRRATAIGDAPLHMRVQIYFGF